MQAPYQKPLLSLAFLPFHECSQPIPGSGSSHLPLALSRALSSLIATWLALSLSFRFGHSLLSPPQAFPDQPI